MLDIPEEQPVKAIVGDSGGSGGNSLRLGGILLIVFSLAACIGGLGAGPRMGDHECINALAARHVLSDGGFIIPHIGDDPWVRKTPTGIWLITAAAYFLDAGKEMPVSEFTARLPSGIAAFLTVMVVWWLGRMMYGPRAGLVSGFVAASSLGTFFFSHNAQVDMVLTLFTTLSFALFWRGALSSEPCKLSMLGFYVALGLAMMAKAPLPMAVCGLSLAVYWLLIVPTEQAITGPNATAQTRSLKGFLAVAWAQVRAIRKLMLFRGILVFLLVFAPWPLWVLTQVAGVPKLWMIEYLHRLGGDLRSKSEPWYEYIPILFGMVLPYSLSLPEAVAAPILKRYVTYLKGLNFAWTWAIVGTVFLSIPSFKQPHYVLSVLPAYFLLLGPVIDRLFFGTLPASRETVRYLCRILPAVLVVALIAGGIVLSLMFDSIPGLFRVYLVVALIGGAGWVASSLLFADGKRLLSFGSLNIGMLAGFLIAWPSLASAIGRDPETEALIRHFREQGIEQNDNIYWVEGRPKAFIEFYDGYRIKRLFRVEEMAELRPGRYSSIEEEVKKAYRDRIDRILGETERVYFVMEKGNAMLLKGKTKNEFLPVFELNGFQDENKAGKELVVITQKRAEHDVSTHAAPQPG